MLPKSEIARAAGITIHPVAIVWTEKKPVNALEFREGVWGCVMWLFAKVAMEGRTAVFSRDTTTCAGGAIGLGFGRPFERHSCGDEEGFCSFLSNGVEGAADRKSYEARVAKAEPRSKKVLTEGERFLKSPAIVRNFLANLPFYDAKEGYIVMKPIHEVEESEDVRSVVFVANPDQISALSILANYATGNIRDGVIVAAGTAGCQAMGVCTYAEGESDRPRAVVGLTDLSARQAVRRTLGKGVLTFSVPLALYREMEGNVPGSFLELDLWKELRG